MGETRRAHNKSRLGCSECKRRRIKCDGRHPTCANCEKRNLECSFLLLVPCRPSPTSASPADQTAQAPRRLPLDARPRPTRPSSPTSRSTSPQSVAACNSHATTPAASSPSGTAAPTDAWGRCRNSLGPKERILMDHYLHSTCETIATDEKEHAAWRQFVPQLLPHHPYLVHGMLSVAALDLARLHNGPEREELHRTAAERMNRAISVFRVELDNINEKNASALFAHSTLTALYFFRTSSLDMQAARASIPPGSTEPPRRIIDEMITSFVRIMWGLRGALCVLKPGWNWVVGGELSALCNRKWWPKQRIPNNERAKEEDQRLAGLEELWTGRPYNAEHAEWLSEALKSLRESYVLVSLLTDAENEWPRLRAILPYLDDNTTVGMLKDRAAIFVWGVQVKKELILLAEQGNREVLVLVAHYAVLMGRVKNVWWMEGLGENTIWAFTKALHPEDRHLVQWPTEALGMDLLN